VYRALVFCNGGKPAGERRLANPVLAVPVAAIHAKHRQRYASRAQAKLDLIDGIEGFHTSIRLPLAIDSRSPADFERSSKAA